MGIVARSPVFRKFINEFGCYKEINSYLCSNLCVESTESETEPCHMTKNKQRNEGMTIIPIAHFRSPLKSKFGIPRQSGLANSLEGVIVLEPDYRHPEALRGIEDFDFLWLIWEFSANKTGETESQPSSSKEHLTVRPPLLGGNKRMGVFATRSPFRPNRLGLSSVRLQRIDWEDAEGPVIYVSGADLMDGTPIYDIKPYLRYVDSHTDARGGFTDTHQWEKLTVIIPEEIRATLNPQDQQTLQELLELDPRPHYQDDPDRIYGFTFNDRDCHFRVRERVAEVLSLGDISKK